MKSPPQGRGIGELLLENSENGEPGPGMLPCLGLGLVHFLNPSVSGTIVWAGQLGLPLSPQRRDFWTTQTGVCPQVPPPSPNSQNV